MEIESEWTANNRLNTTAAGVFTYDAAGDVTFDGNNYYAYDAEGRVCSMQTSPYAGGILAYGYIYDAEGRRVGKGTVTPAPLGQAPSCNLSSNGFTLTESYVLGQSGERLTTLGWTGGYWVDGTVTNVNLYTNSNDVGLSGYTADSSGSRTSTDAFYTSAQSSMGSALLTSWGYSGLIGTVDLSRLYKSRPMVGSIGPQNPIDVAAGCIGSGVGGVASDVSGYGLLKDLQSSAMTGSLNPLLNSGDKLNDAGNAIDLTDKAASALAKTLPVAGRFGKVLGPVGTGITVVKAARDLYNFVN